MAMNPEIKARWQEKLRSGEYQQGSGMLAAHTESGDKFCCLGVLCEIAVADGIILRELRPETGRYAYGTAISEAQRQYLYPEDIAPTMTNAADADTQMLPRSVMKWSGLTQLNPFVEVSTGRNLHRRYSLGHVNDYLKFSLGEIADLVEQL